jgi:hypothetical protein
LCEQTTFVEAMTPEHKYAAEMMQGWKETRRRQLVYAAAFYSQLAALKVYLESTTDECAPFAIVFENDVVLHDDFRAQFNSIWNSEVITADLKLLSLTYIVKHPHRATKVSANLCRLNPTVFGAQGYVMSRAYAKSLVELLDRPVIDILRDQEALGVCKSQAPGPGMQIAWEYVIQRSNGVFTMPMLVIEEGLDSSMQATTSNNWFGSFRRDFLKHEPVDSLVRKAWTITNTKS